MSFFIISKVYILNKKTSVRNELFYKLQDHFTHVLQALPCFAKQYTHCYKQTLLPLQHSFWKKILGFLMGALNQGVYGVGKIMEKIYTLKKSFAYYPILVECYLFFPFQMTIFIQRSIKPISLIITLVTPQVTFSLCSSSQREPLAPKVKKGFRCQDF